MPKRIKLVYEEARFYAAESCACALFAGYIQAPSDGTKLCSGSDFRVACALRLFGCGALSALLPASLAAAKMSGFGRAREIEEGNLHLQLRQIEKFIAVLKDEQRLMKISGK